MVKACRQSLRSVEMKPEGECFGTHPRGVEGDDSDNESKSFCSDSEYEIEILESQISVRLE